MKSNDDFIIIIFENKTMENMNMRKIEEELNKLLVQLFNDILQIEEKSLKKTYIIYKFECLKQSIQVLLALNKI